MFIKKMLSAGSSTAGLLSNMVYRPLFQAQQAQFMTMRPLLPMQPSYVLNRPSLLQCQLSHFSTGKKLLFKTDSPAKSNKYHYGLYHKKTHGKRYQRCFSMK